MDPEPKQHRSRRWLCLLALLLLAAVGALWKFWPTPPPPRTALATVRFPNGSRVDLLAIAVDKSLDDGFDASGSVRPTFSGGLFSGFHGDARGSSMHGPYRAEVHHHYKSEDGRLTGAKIVTVQPSLLLLVQGFDSDGKPGALEGKSQRSGKPAANAVLTQVETWNGAQLGWQPMDGPFQPEPKDPRAFCDTPTFLREAPKLRLRFTQTGQPPVELEVDNPNPVTATPWAAKDVLPTQKHVGETDVRFSVLPWRRDTDGTWSALPLAEAVAPPWHFNAALVSVEDASGNYALANCPVNLPPGNGAWRAKFQVSRGSDYPTPINEATVVGDGEFVALDQPVKFTPTPAFAAQFGTAQFSANAQAGGGWEGEKDLTTLHLKGTMAGQGASPALPGNWRLYVDDQALPGHTMMTGGGSSSNGNSYQIDFDLRWAVRIAPGTKFKLATQKANTPVEVEVQFDPPPFQTPAASGEKKPGNP